MNKIVKIYNAFGIIITSDKEQEELTTAYLDKDWTEIGRIISENVTRDIIQSEANFREALKKCLGGVP